MTDSLIVVPKVTAEHIRQLGELGFVYYIDEHGRLCQLAKDLYCEGVALGKIKPGSSFQ